MRAEIEIKLLENLLEEITVKYDRYIKEQDAEIKQKLQKSKLDPLTHIHNREFLCEQGKVMLKENRRKSESLALIFLDLDNFKGVNDNHGHNEGDRVLKSVAKILKSSFREEDVVARYGGDEFVVIVQLSRVHLSDLNHILESLRKRVEESFKRYNISISYGISIYPVDADNLKDLIQLADERMYEQKKEKKRCRT